MDLFLSLVKCCWRRCVALQDLLETKRGAALPLRRCFAIFLVRSEKGRNERAHFGSVARDSLDKLASWLAVGQFSPLVGLANKMRERARARNACKSIELAPARGD